MASCTYIVNDQMVVDTTFQTCTGWTITAGSNVDPLTGVTCSTGSVTYRPILFGSNFTNIRLQQDYVLPTNAISITYGYQFTTGSGNFINGAFYNNLDFRDGYDNTATLNSFMSSGTSYSGTVTFTNPTGFTTVDNHIWFTPIYSPIVGGTFEEYTQISLQLISYDLECDCELTGTTDISCSTLSVISAFTDSATCFTGGTIGVTISGSNPSYQYNLYDGNGLLYFSANTNSTSYQFTNIPEGSWNIRIIDSIGQIAVVTTPLIVNNVFYTNTSIINGDICLTISGGTIPYTVIIDGNVVPWTSGESGSECYSATCRTYSGITTTPSTGSTVHQYDKIVVVIFENHSYNDIMLGAAPNFNTFANQGVLFTNSHGIGHPSQPNYFHLFAGSNQGVTSDNCPTGPFNSSNIFKTLQDVGKTYLAYSENLGTPGSTACSVGGGGGYWRKHAPWVSFNNFGPHTPHELDYISFPTPGNYNSLPNLSFVVPNQVNDMHNGSISAGNSWLQQNMSAYAAWCVNNNSLLIITFDEDDFTATNQIPTIFVGANIIPGQTYSNFINHHNVLRTIAESLEPTHSSPYPGNSENVAPITGIWDNTSNPNPNAGYHTIVIYDISGCSSSTIVNITCSSPILVLDSYSASTCINDGFIQVHISGGTQPFNYFVTSGTTTFTNTSGIFNNLPPGIWNVHGVDSLGYSSQIITLDLSSKFYSSLYLGTGNTFCIIVTGATEPIYGILDGNPYGTFINSPIPQCLSASCGPHTFTLADDTDCSLTTNFFISCDTLSLIIDSIHKTTCNPRNDGYIQVHASGGSIPYVYSIVGTLGNVYPNSIPTVGPHIFNGLAADTYTITVTDSLGTTSTVSNVVVTPNLLSTINIISPITGDTIGQVCFNITGGSRNYDVTITNQSFGTTTLTRITTNTFCFSGDCGIPYLFNIVDTETRCELDYNIIIPCEPIGVNIINTDPTCYDQSPLNGGTITVNITGGTTPFTIIIDNGTLEYSAVTNISYTFIDLPSGSWSVRVLDSGGVIYDHPTTIDLISNTLFTNFSSSGACQNNGTYCVNVSGGTLPYIIGLTTQSLPYTDIGIPYTATSAGTYCFTANCGNSRIYVLDNSPVPCIETNDLLISCPIEVSITKNQTDVVCVGTTDVILTLEYTGGTAPYSFIWNNGETTQQINGSEYVTGSGLYSFTGSVIDANGCSGTSVVSFSAQSSATPTLLITLSGELYCNLSQIPTITATISGSSYSNLYWSNGITTNLSITANTPGDYYYVVQNGSCTYTSDTVTVSYPETPPPIIDSLYSNLCICETNTIWISNEEEPSIYSGITWLGSPLIIANDNGTNSISVSSCTTGTYYGYITVVDQYGCTLTSNTVTISFTELDATIFTLNASCLTCADGYAEVQNLIGTPPYSYLWTGSTSTTNVATNLVPGDYCVQITDSANCVKIICFEITGEDTEICVDIPVVNPITEEIRLNPDGSISFYNPNIPNSRLETLRISEVCCLTQSTAERPLFYCDGVCYWGQPKCDNIESYKIILGMNDNAGIQLISDGECSFQASFDYLFNFDCQKLLTCILGGTNQSVLGFFSGLSLNATIEVLSGSIYETYQTIPVWKFNFYDQPTGIYFNGESNACETIHNIIYTELGLNCTAFTESTFASIWKHISFKLDDNLMGKTIKLGLILNGFNCEYNILLDNLKIDKVCLVTNEDILTDTSCPGFEIDKVVDNKKSWVYNDSVVDRTWDHLNYRHTSYVDNHERLDINTKEIDLDIDGARAIEYDAFCYSQTDSCFISNDCNYPELLLPIVGEIESVNGSLSCFDTTTFNSRKLSFPTSGITTGKRYDIRFNTTIGGLGSDPFLSIGFETPNVTAEEFVIDNILLNQSSGYTITLLSPGNFTNIYFRTTSWVQGFIKKSICLEVSNMSLTEHCELNDVNLSNFINVDEINTFEDFKELIQTQLIDAKNRQSISDYPLLRYMFDKYLGFCGLNNCDTNSNQYNYDSLNNFSNLIGDYWIKLIEQFVPATSIWNGASRSYRNTIFDQPKFEYRNFSLGYCNPQYCIDGSGPGNSNSSGIGYSAYCYIADSVSTPLTTTGFQSWADTYLTLNNDDILGKLTDCANDEVNDINCSCNVHPLSCFMSTTIKLELIEGSNTINIQSPKITDINSLLLTSTNYLDLLYSGLTQLGYDNSTPHNGFQWSKTSTVGCSNPIIPTFSFDIQYSCVTGNTTSTGGSLLYEPLYYDFPIGHTNLSGKINIIGGKAYGVSIDNSGTIPQGYIYSFEISSSTFTILKNFTNGETLRNPCTDLVVGSDGYLYGGAYTNDNPTLYQYGGLYKIDPNNPTDYSVLHKFDSNDFGGVNPLTKLLLHSDGNIYIPLSDPNGSTTSIYKWNVSTQIGSPIYSFNYSARQIFISEDTSNNYIIGTSSGPGNDGTIFTLNPNSPLSTFQKLYDFATTISPNINLPRSPLIQSQTSSNIFYGLTYGTLSTYSSLFEYNKTTNTINLLHRFNVGIPPNGFYPMGGMVIVDNIIYGNCNATGTIVDGTLFRYNLLTNQNELVHEYIDGIDGANNPDTDTYFVYNSSDGYIYGTTSSGGNSNTGTLFRFKYSGATTESAGVGVFNCTNITFGDIPNINKLLVEYSSSTIQSISGITGCTQFCSGEYVNSNIEILVQNITNEILSPCILNPIILSCNTIYSLHNDNDVWFEGSINVYNPTSTSNNNNIYSTNIIHD